MLEPFALAKPVLVAALFVLAEMAWIEVFSMLAETLDDVGVGKAVEEPSVNLVSHGFWEARDFAVAAVGQVRRLEAGCRRFGSSGSVLRKREDFRI